MLSGKHHDTQSILDMVVLQGLESEVIYQDWVLVQKRPDPAEIFYAGACFIPRKMFPNDSHVVVLSHYKTVSAMFGISTVMNGDEPAYLITLDVYDASRSSQFALLVLRIIAQYYTPLQFRDSDILEEVCRTKPSKIERIKAYLEHEDRTGPVFIKRVNGIDSKKNESIALRHAILSLFGPVISSTALFNQYKEGPLGRNEILAVSRDGLTAPFMIGDGEVFDRDIADFFEWHETYPFDKETRVFNPISPEAISIWKNAVELGDTPDEYPKNAEEYYYQFLQLTAQMDQETDLKNAANTALLVQPAATIPETLPVAPEASAILETEPVVPIRPVPDKDRLPDCCDDIVPWIEAHYADSIVVMPRAARALSKSKHPNPERIAASLRLLAEGKLACYSGQDRGLTHAAFEKGLLELRLRDTFTNAERLAGRTGEAYIVNYEGRRVLLDRHLASQSSAYGDPRLLRIYYAYDRPTQKIVVGYLPDHLPTTKS